MSSQASSSASPASITEEISNRTMSDVVNAEELIEYLKKKNLKLEESHFEILCKEEISGLAFLDTTKRGFSKLWLESWSRNNTCKIYRINKDITNIKQFTLVFEEINDDDKAFGHCMDDIIQQLSNVESITDANKATRCEFISAILLHASIAIAKKLTSQDIFKVLQKDISGEDATGRVTTRSKVWKNYLLDMLSAYQTNKKKRTADQAFGNDYFDYLYGIVTTGTEWHFIIYTPDGIYCTSGSEHQINLTKSAVKENPELLRNNVKMIIGIIVWVIEKSC
ncbi:hypothetical protein RclHR1_04820018 [Rhizophagus clarus]|uniref:Uncharacterized protein n=1 Tax=Rhizophagus clarus TaxID=94130 RepID=A0A2Z6S110_9GLOM|nr:hypothetical protein RclHR1_04820018 [Rhizophagus clarus]